MSDFGADSENLRGGVNPFAHARIRTTKGRGTPISLSVPTFPFTSGLSERRGSGIILTRCLYVCCGRVAVVGVVVFF